MCCVALRTSCHLLPLAGWHLLKGTNYDNEYGMFTHIRLWKYFGNNRIIMNKYNYSITIKCREKGLAPWLLEGLLGFWRGSQGFPTPILVETP